MPRPRSAFDRRPSKCAADGHSPPLRMRQRSLQWLQRTSHSHPMQSRGSHRRGPPEPVGSKSLTSRFRGEQGGRKSQDRFRRQTRIPKTAVKCLLGVSVLLLLPTAAPAGAGGAIRIARYGVSVTVPARWHGLIYERPGRETGPKLERTQRAQGPRGFEVSTGSRWCGALGAINAWLGVSFAHRRGRMQA